jgi:hypothetical protein
VQEKRADIVVNRDELLALFTSLKDENEVSAAASGCAPGVQRADPPLEAERTDTVSPPMRATTPPPPAFTKGLKN